MISTTSKFTEKCIAILIIIICIASIDKINIFSNKFSAFKAGKINNPDLGKPYLIRCFRPIRIVALSSCLVGA